MSIHIPRNAIVDVYCPNCGQRLFTYDPNAGIFNLEPFWCHSWLEKLNNYIRKGKCCRHCGFHFEDIDSTIFYYYRFREKFEFDVADKIFANNPQIQDYINHTKSRYKKHVTFKVEER